MTSPTKETVTVQQGDGRFLIFLPISIDVLVTILAGVTARWPDATTIDTGRDDALVLELGPEGDR